MAKVAVSLKQPDKIMLHYGDEKVELKMSTPFPFYLIEIEEKDLPRLQHLLHIQKGGDRNG